MRARVPGLTGGGSRKHRAVAEDDLVESRGRGRRRRRNAETLPWLRRIVHPRSQRTRKRHPPDVLELGVGRLVESQRRTGLTIVASCDLRSLPVAHDFISAAVHRRGIDVGLAASTGCGALGSLGHLLHAHVQDVLAFKPQSLEEWIFPHLVLSLCPDAAERLGALTPATPPHALLRTCACPSCLRGYVGQR